MKSLDELDAFESGVIEIGHALETGARARERLLVEYQRIQGLDPYGVLMIEHAATRAEIAAARTVTARAVRARPIMLGSIAAQDLAKLDEVLAAYDGRVPRLLEASRRAALDRQLSAERAAQASRRSAPSSRSRTPSGCSRAESSPPRSPACARRSRRRRTEPDYHASLGWALWGLRRTPAGSRRGAAAPPPRRGDQTRSRGRARVHRQDRRSAGHRRRPGAVSPRARAAARSGAARRAGRRPRDGAAPRR